MDIESRHSILEIQLMTKLEILHAIERLKLGAALIILFTIFIAYLRPASSTNVFISLLAFLIVQIFTTKEYIELAAVARKIRIIVGGGYFPCNKGRKRWTIAAGVAIRDAYFFLLLFFDISWLAHAYLYPAPAVSFTQFLLQLGIGPVSGVAFIWFTIGLWILYTYLLLIGILYSGEINFPETVNETQPVFNNPDVQSCECWIKVKPYDGNEFYLQGNHLNNPQKQPLILFPGFFQNGYVYDLSEKVSLARFLWESNFDIWIIHPRGTAQSDGRHKRSSIDDFASDDIPAIINYVFLKTGIKPVFVGHSQGGISAIISMMGALKINDSEVILSDTAGEERQRNLHAMVTLGSYLDFSFSKESALKNFVKEGVVITWGGKKITLLKSNSILNILNKFNFVGMPVSFKLRSAFLQSGSLEMFLFPLALLLNFISKLSAWKFLYNIPNVNTSMRQALFYKTMDGTFSPVLSQFYFALKNDVMKSSNGEVNYSINYQRVTLPVSIVAMEFDSLADPEMMEQKMFNKISSNNKFFTLWTGVGHEDHFTNTKYFPQVLAAIKKVC